MEKISIKEATVIQLKAVAFDLNQQLLQIQDQYRIILDELRSREQKEIENKESQDGTTTN